MDAPRTLAEQLQALKSYRNRPEDHPEPLQSNWTTVPANDNADPEEIADFSFERNLLVTPSVQEIMRQVRLGPVVRNEEGKIVSIGKLRFSDGNQVERAYTRGPDGDVIQFNCPMPAGAMLGTVEKAKEQAGGKGYTQAQLVRSNQFFAETLDTAPPRYIRRTKRRNGKSLTAEESRALIDEAIANTPVMPPVTKCPPGLPCGGQRVADAFVGMQKAPKGESGSIAWQDIAWTLENARIWRRIRKSLRERDIKALDAAMSARTLADIGEAVGQAPEYARRKGGRRALIAANDNLAAAIKKYAA